MNRALLGDKSVDNKAFILRWSYKGVKGVENIFGTSKTKQCLMNQPLYMYMYHNNKSASNLHPEYQLNQHGKQLHVLLFNKMLAGQDGPCWGTCYENTI